MNLRSLIARHGASYTVTRTAESTLLLGRRVDGAVTSVSLVAVVQPVTGREIQILPELQHGEETKVIYTLTQLYTREPGFEPDSISVDGESYDVTRVDKFTQLSGAPHYVAYAKRRVQ